MILTDWMINSIGHRLVKEFDSSLVNPASLDCRLADDIKLQVFHGIELPDLPARLFPDGTMELSVLGDVFRTRSYFHKGDAFLASTVESFTLPRWLSFQWIDKSSTGREGLAHRHAGWAEADWHGNLTLEYDVARSGSLVPFQPIGQVVFQTTFVASPYSKRKNSRYHKQVGTVSNKNKKQLAFTASAPGTYGHQMAMLRNILIAMSKESNG